MTHFAHDVADRLARTVTRRGLARLSDHMLSDIGFRREDLAPARFREIWTENRR